MVDKTLGRVLDVATIAALGVFLITATGYVRSRLVGQTDDTVAVGTALTIPGAELAPHKKTLVLALQAECMYCEASMSFYKDVIASNAAGSFQVIAVVPHSRDAGTAVLKASGVDIAQVVHADFTRLRIASTPTLILADENGIVRNVWIGKLNARTEDLVFTKLGVDRRVRTLSDKSESDRLRPVLDAVRREATVIDIRPRVEFRKGRIAGAISMPLDELDIRIPHEVPEGGEVLLYCDSQPHCPVVLESAEGETWCETAAKAVNAKGFAKVVTVGESLETLDAVGVPVVRTGG